MSLASNVALKGRPTPDVDAVARVAADIVDDDDVAMASTVSSVNVRPSVWHAMHVIVVDRGDVDRQLQLIAFGTTVVWVDILVVNKQTL